MEEETREFLRERSDRIRLLHENQAKELERFDDESVRLGFRFSHFSFCFVLCVCFALTTVFLNVNEMTTMQCTSHC